MKVETPVAGGDRVGMGDVGASAYPWRHTSLYPTPSTSPARPLFPQNPRNQRVTYRLRVKTSDRQGAGTDANVYIDLRGDLGSTGGWLGGGTWLGGFVSSRPRKTGFG